MFWLLIWTEGLFLVVGNWQSSIVHFAALFHGRIGRPMFHHLWWQGPKYHIVSPKGLGKFVTLLCFCSSVSSFGTIFAHTFLMWRSSVKIFLTVSLSMFTCSDMSLTGSRRFSRKICRKFAMFFQFCLLLAVLISFRQWHFSSLTKTFHPLVNCCFLHSIIRVNLH